MLKVVLSLGIISTFVGCKSAAKAPAKVEAHDSISMDDDGAIDVPKELEEKAVQSQNLSLTSRSRFTHQNKSKDLKPGAILAIKVRGVRALQLDVFAQKPVERISLNLKGSSLYSVDIKAAMSSLEIPVKSLGEETIEVVVPIGNDYGLQVTQLIPKDGGEIISWEVVDR